jgi:hypothetical protein
MAKSYLIDTSSVIKYLNESQADNGLRFIDDIIDEDCILSFISEIELQVWNPPNEADLEVYNYLYIRRRSLALMRALFQKPYGSENHTTSSYRMP